MSCAEGSPGDAAGAPEGDARPALQALEQRLAQPGVLQRHAFAFRVGQERRLGGVHHREAADGLRAGALQGGGESQRDEVLDARGVDELPGELFLVIRPGIDEKYAKPEGAQRRGRRAARLSGARDECVKIAQAMIQSMVYIPALEHRMSSPVGVRPW